MHSVDHNSWVNRGQLLPPLSLAPQISSQAAQLKVLPALSNTAARNTRHSPTRNGVRCREQGCWQPPWCRLILSESPELQDRPCTGCRDLTADTPVAHTEECLVCCLFCVFAHQARLAELVPALQTRDSCVKAAGGQVTLPIPRSPVSLHLLLRLYPAERFSSASKTES